MKAKSYKLKYVPTVQQLRDAGFRPGGAWIHAEAFMFAERKMISPQLRAAIGAGGKHYEL